ncbi:hypothetical protein OPKNFCMD_2747 [Methylobacterium crusticola]|uniref:DUF4188 domain-containing protein n=1 Tax=Methylobacterium crusticola TaxID=1697972 RepID=A0ABQ4QXC7_9HYPH|nr:DUF4188 domain-containing protein [Methylobacterium crusticola]GJD50011.1 hypothetical protein OPKNFCMD_2747 [Methylobacterium crusticola]
MSAILRERTCAEMPGDVVVFAIGMRINTLWKVWRWLPVLMEMPPMLREQEADPSIGLLSSRPTFGLRNIGVLQHWRSVEDLHAYAHAAGGLHSAAWKRFNARIGANGDVGIWHETYVVPAGRMESIFVNMPRYGMGLAGQVFPARGERASAAGRLARSRA